MTQIYGLNDHECYFKCRSSPGGSVWYKLASWEKLKTSVGSQCPDRTGRAGERERERDDQSIDIQT